MICQLSEEKIFDIFSYLNAQDLSLCCRVSQLFRRIASDQQLWKSLFPTLIVPPGKDVRTYVQENCLLNRRVIKHRLIETLSQENRSSLKFRFLHHPGLTVDTDVDFCSDMPPFRRPPKLEKTYHVLEKLPIKLEGTHSGSSGCISKEKNGIKYEYTYSGSSEEISLLTSTLVAFDKKGQQEAAEARFNTRYYYISAIVALVSLVVQAHLNQKC